MQRQLYISFIIVWLAVGTCPSVYAQREWTYSSVPENISMGSTSSYRTNAVYQSFSEANSSRTSGALSSQSVPYRFRSTSIYLPQDGGYNRASTSASYTSRPRKSIWDDEEPEDDPIGTVPDATPVGDTPWLLMVFAAIAYIAFRRYRRRLSIRDFEHGRP